MKRVDILAKIFLAIAGLLFCFVLAEEFRMNRTSVLPMTIWGVGFLVASSLLLRGKRDE